MESKLLLGDCKDKLKELDDNSVDLMATDPPYGLSFMGKEWDSFNEVENIERDMPNTVYAKKGFKKLPRNKPIAMKEFFVPIWKECLRVLKPGGFAFVMAAPKQDVLRKQIETLEEAGFRTDFTSIYWTYATGFPKAMNIGKAVDKRLGKEREVVGTKIGKGGENLNKLSRENKGDDEEAKGMGAYGVGAKQENVEIPITAPASDEAKDLDGSYAGFQPKPAVEVVIVAMKPLDKKGYIDQALDNQKGVTWLDDCRIPFADPSVEDKRLIEGGSWDTSKMGENIYSGGWAGKRVPSQKKKLSDKEQYDKDNVGSQKNFDTEAEGLSRGNQPSRKKSDTYERVSAFGDTEQSETKDGRNLWGKKATKKVKITKRQPRTDHNVFKQSGFKSEENDTAEASPMGRFAANLLVSDNSLDQGKTTKSSGGRSYQNTNDMYSGGWSSDDMGTSDNPGKGDSGDFSRYFSLDEWWKQYFSELPEEVQKTFPFLIVPKASKREKNDGIKDGKNIHPTCKPLTLFSYLLVLGSRKGDTILDPFAGSGTTGIACVFSERNYILIEREKEYFKIMEARINKAKNPAGLVQHEWF